MKKVWILFIFVLFALSATAENQPLKIHFIDVGEGDSILIEAPSGEVALVDSGNFIRGVKVAEYLKKNNINSLDHFILTHLHLDHIGGAFYLFQTLEVRNIYDNGSDLQESSGQDDTYRWYSDLIRMSNKYIMLGAGDSLNLGQVKLKVLWPAKPFISSDFNANSLVIMVEYKGFRCLLTGDLTTISEKELLKGNINLKANVLKVGHHGFKDASSKDFLKAISAKISIISVNKDNIRGYPSLEALSRLKGSGAEIYRTDKVGDIVVQVDGQGKIKVRKGK